MTNTTLKSNKNRFYELNSLERIIRGWENINTKTVLVPGETDLRSKFPSISKEWHPTKNGSLLPENVEYDSDLPIWWICKRGHSWFSSIKSRTNSNSPSSCKYCTEIEEELKDKERFIDTHPELVLEWDFEKNKDVLIEDISTDSNRIVYWECKNNHSYKQVVSKRTLESKGCSECPKLARGGIDDLATTHPHIVSEWDFEKNTSISPYKLKASDTQYAWWKCSKCSASWEKKINLKVRHNNKDCPRCDGVGPIKRGLNDLMTTHPHIAKEWAIEENERFFNHVIPNKNRPSPTTVSCNSRIVVEWNCPEGHNWQASPYQRIISGKKCTECNPSYQATTGINDLVTLYPKIASEWAFDLNKHLRPEIIRAKSSREVWWRCSKNHEWEEKVVVRVRSANPTCPYCAGKLPVQGETDLATTHPHLIDEWDFKKNTLKPTEVFSSTTKYVYWTCKNNHPWKERINLRAERKYKCPYCSGRKLLEGENDLESLYPELAKEWHPDNLLHASKTLPKTRTIGLWRCSQCGHEWKKSIGARLKNGKCPKCSKQKNSSRRINVNHMNRQQKLYKGTFYSSKQQATIHWTQANPLLLKEWDFELNIRGPLEFSGGSNKKVFWKCLEHNHPWEASVKTRVQGSNCPYCSNRKLLAGFNDLNTTHGHLMHMWDYKKNTGINPEEVFGGTKKKAWFICHISKTEWEARICDWSKGKVFKHCRQHCKGKLSECS